jgi:hypothetical protein
MVTMRHKLPPLELRLLRRSVQHLSEGRERCADCRRSPLVGERVHRYADGAIVCALCRQSHGGEPEGSELVSHSELGRAVKPAAPIAA